MTPVPATGYGGASRGVGGEYAPRARSSRPDHRRRGRRGRAQARRRHRDRRRPGAAGARRRLALDLRWESGAEILRTLVNAGAPGARRGAPPRRRDLPASGDDPLKRLLLEGGRTSAWSTTRACTRSSARCSSGSGCARAWRRRSCSATPRGASCGRRATPASPDFGERDVRLLNAIAGQVAAAIARAELYGRMTDARVPGRADRAREPPRAGRAARGRARARRAGARDEVTLLLCDVDNLKALNQGRGHHGGDWALKAVAGALRMAAEGLPTRSCAATRGDEFAAARPRRGAPRPCGA